MVLWLDTPIIVHDTDEVIVVIEIYLDDVQTRRDGNTIITTYYRGCSPQVKIGTNFFLFKRNLQKTCCS